MFETSGNKDRQTTDEESVVSPVRFNKKICTGSLTPKLLYLYLHLTLNIKPQTQ
jgi:hypothetical protein